MHITWFSGQLITADCSTAVMSSTASADAGAARACDSETDTNFFNPKRCTHTMFSNNNWWQVELTSAGNVTVVDIYLRSDCCNTFTFMTLHDILQLAI